MLPLGYFRRRGFATANAVIFFQFTSLIGSLFFITQLFQIGLGYSPLAAGLRILVWMAMPMLVAPVVSYGALVAPLVIAGWGPGWPRWGWWPRRSPRGRRRPRYGEGVAGPAVAVRGVRVGYGSFAVLEDVDLTVAAGEIVAVTGVNGAGKSTLLSCLAGLHQPAAGTVTVLGVPPRDDAAFWRAVALVADQPTWYPGLTLREHLELVRLTHEPVRGWCLPTDELIEVFGLPGRADAVPFDLSSGQRQRLSLAAALARPSRLLLLDEPEQSLDPGFRQELAGLLRDYAGHGGTVVMATHDLDFAAAAGARLMLVADGQMVTPEAELEAGP